MLGFLLYSYIFITYMKKSELKNIITESVEEVVVENRLQESFDYDAIQLQERLLTEGFIDSTQDVLKSVPTKTKQQLTEPLIYAILTKLKQSDPNGFAQLQQYAKDPKKLNQLLNHPTIQKQSAKAGKELANGQLNEGDSEFEESFYNHLEEALQRGKVPDKYQAAAKAYSDKNPSQKYDWNKSVDDNTPKKPDSGGAFGKTKWKLKPRDPVKPQKYEDPESFPSKRDTSPEIKKPEPSADIKNKQNSLVGMADRAGIAALKGLGKAGTMIGDKLQKLGQTKAGQQVGKATIGIVSRTSSFIKNHPKLSAGIAIGLIAAIGTAAAIGSGGVIPLITSTLTAGIGGAVKGGAIGSVVGAGKEMVNQASSGDVKSFKDMDYKKVGSAGLKAGGKGAAIGAAVGAGANVLGKAAAGISKIFSSGQVTSNPNSFLRDLTPEEQRALGIEGKTWAEKFNRDDMNTWKIKPKINSQQGYLNALKQNELLYKGITGHDAAELINAKIQAASEKAAKGLKFVTDQAEIYKNGGGVDLDSLKDIIGSVGQGASKNQTESMINAYLDGHLPKEKLVSYFTKMAMRVTTK